VHESSCLFGHRHPLSSLFPRNPVLPVLLLSTLSNMLPRTLRTVISRSRPTSILFQRANSSQPPRSSTERAPAKEKSTTYNDPFPLPFSAELTGKEGTVNEDSLAPLRVPRGDESPQTLKARLVYQSRKRGTLETDLLLSTFAGENLDNMSVEEMKEFDRLMDENDWDIYYWAIGKKEPPARWAESPLMPKIQKHAVNEGKAVRRMPDLK